MNDHSQQEAPHDHVVLRRDLLLVCGLALGTFVAMAALWYSDQRTGVLATLAANWL